MELSCLRWSSLSARSRRTPFLGEYRRSPLISPTLAHGACGVTNPAPMFRFTIRDLLWLTALCAVIIYAYSDRRKTRLRIAASEAEQSSERTKLEQSRADFERERATIHASLNDSQAHLHKQ